MLTVKSRNVHQALPEVLYQLFDKGVERESRNGPVLVFPYPVCIEYERPTERVMFWEARDANPFFHFMEALWMLAGRNDVAFPQQFNANFGQFSDDGVTFHGAYGHRWLKHFGFDQLEVIAQSLKANPDDRRQVLSMWDARADLGKDGKDLPCNLQAVFQRGPAGELNMTVYNRSNDIVWGALGANAVHFSFLQEFLATAIGCPVGRYWQISANMHGYRWSADALKPLVDKAWPSDAFKHTDPYEQGVVDSYALCPSGDLVTWQQDLRMFLDEGDRATGYRDAFFRRVALPMLRAYRAFKDAGNPERFANARNEMKNCAASDWRLACNEWINRRETKWKQRQSGAASNGSSS